MSATPSLEAVQSVQAHPDRITIVPIHRQVSIGDHSPTTVFRSIRSKAQDDKHCFLLETSTAKDPVKTHYSIIGVDPFHYFQTTANSGDPLAQVEPLVSRFFVPEAYRISEPYILNGGAFGFISYDCVRYYEYKVAAYPQPDNLVLPESAFMLCGSFVCFDHLSGTIRLVALCAADLDVTIREANYNAALNRLTELENALNSAQSASSYLPTPLVSAADQRAVEKAAQAGEIGYKAMVSKLKERIVDGDIIQCVPSHRVKKPLENNLHALEVYEELRSLNPSRYMFYVECESFYIVGSSPELLVKVRNGLVETHPIAGTRHRGKTPEADLELERELLSDEKERAEHIMLVDLGRNDVNRVAQPHTTKVQSLMHIERYSHVMHIVSQVTGQLRSGCTAFDAFRSIFPAGTLSGAPKVKAMELIAQLENERRNIYGGSVGYFSFDGNIDTSIAIRTLVVKDSNAYLQAGGGIVFDSEEQAEYQETVNKMAATARAIDLAAVKKTGHSSSSSSLETKFDSIKFNGSISAALASHQSKQPLSHYNTETAGSISTVSAGVKLVAAAQPQSSSNITLMIDNFDSFTWNIYQYLCQLSSDPVVVLRNDATLDQCIALNPKRVVISPGPGWPHEAGVSNEAIKHFLGKVPLLGVCLGHECLVELYGGKIIHCGEIKHGKTSPVYHDGKGIFSNVPDGVEAIRYHSLAMDPNIAMPDFEVTSKTSNGIIMGIRHKKFKVEGVQFHPESIKTDHGLTMIKNFLEWEGPEW